MRKLEIDLDTFQKYPGLELKFEDRFDLLFFFRGLYLMFIHNKEASNVVLSRAFYEFDNFETYFNIDFKDEVEPKRRISMFLRHFFEPYWFKEFNTYFCSNYKDKTYQELMQEIETELLKNYIKIYDHEY